MKVFLSWSGARSKHIAEALREWLPSVIQAVSPWMSASDIDTGARWSSSLASELEETRFGLICLTPENLVAPWILFEAGALSKTLGKTHVCPYLFDLEPTDLKGPLVQFQAAKAQKEDTKKLVATINQALENGRLPEGKIDKSFEAFWPELESALRGVPTSNAAPTPQRTEREILEELLELARTQTRASVSPSQLPIEGAAEYQSETIKEEIITLLKDEPEAITAMEIAVRTGRSRPDTTRALRRLCDQGRVVREFGAADSALYRIT